METKANAVVVDAKDRGDFDKYLVLLSDRGKMNCIIKGVRRPASKLRFAAELFSVSEYTFSEGKGTAVVTSAYNLSMNYELRTDYDRFYAAGVAAKLAAEFCSEQDAEFFPFFLKSLEFIKADERIGILKFLLELFFRSGYALDLAVCPKCGKTLGETAYYSISDQAAVCETCGGQKIRPGVLRLLRRAEAGDIEQAQDETEEERESHFAGSLRLAAYHLNLCIGSPAILEKYLSSFRKHL